MAGERQEGRDTQVNMLTCLYTRKGERHTFGHHGAGSVSHKTQLYRQRSKATSSWANPALPHLSHHGPSQASEGTDQVLFPAAEALDPQVGAIVSSYASSEQGMCRAGLGRGLWTETV